MWQMLLSSTCETGTCETGKCYGQANVDWQMSDPRRSKWEKQREDQCFDFMLPVLPQPIELFITAVSPQIVIIILLALPTDSLVRLEDVRRPANADRSLSFYLFYQLECKVLK